MWDPVGKHKLGDTPLGTPLRGTNRISLVGNPLEEAHCGTHLEGPVLDITLGGSALWDNPWGTQLPEPLGGHLLLEPP